MKNSVKENKLPWYIEHWSNDKLPADYKFLDKDAEEFHKDFIPLYLKHAGTKKLLGDIRNYLRSHKIIRKDDLRLQLVCMWCDHIHYYRELHEIPFEAEDVFKIRIPKEISTI